MIDVRVGIPYAKVEFATESGDIVIEQKAQLHDYNMDFDILSINTTRDLGGDDCATFNIELIYKDNWYNNISGNDFVKIEFGRGYEAKPILFGMVDTVYKSFAFIDLQVVRTIRISGRGFNKALIQFGIGAVQEVSAYHKDFGFFGGQDTGFGRNNAANVIKTVLDFYTNKGIDMRFANGKQWKDYAQFRYIPAADEISLANTRNYYTYQGGIWDYIKELRNAPFNEVFWEVEDDKPTLTVRPTPFNPSEWLSLRMRVIEDIDIIDQQVGRSDLETYTVYVVKSEHMVDTFNGVYGYPIWYKPNYRKYGLRRLQINSKYIHTEEYPSRVETGLNTNGRNYYLEGEDDTGERVVNNPQDYSRRFDNQFIAQAQAAGINLGTDVFSGGMMNYATGEMENPLADIFVETAESIVKDANSSGSDVSQKTIDLFNWNIKNNVMENGSIMVKGHVNYKVGTRAFIQSEGMEYYIENVSHTFVYNEDWKTTLQVTRGLKPRDRFSAPWNMWAKITTEDMAEIMGVDEGAIEAANNTARKEQADAKKGNEMGETPGKKADKEQKHNDNKNVAPPIAQKEGGTLINPTGDANSRISSWFGWRGDIGVKGASKDHQGMDFPKPAGSPIYSAAGGTVEFAGTKGDGYGNYIVVNHGNGLSTLYAHAQSVGVTKGQKVVAGEQIGKVGNTGVSGGAHIHFEVRVDGKKVDPAPYLGIKRT